MDVSYRLIRRIDSPTGRGTRCLWEVGDHYIITSAVTIPHSGPETYVFRASREGEILSWIELDGSFRGGLNHDTAIAGYVESLIRDK